MPTKIECACGQRILMPDRGTRGKCPRCGRIVEVMGPEDVPPSRLAGKDPSPAAPPRVAIGAWVLCAALALVSVVTSGGWMTLAARTEELERRLDAIARNRIAEDADPPPEPGRRPDPVPVGSTDAAEVAAQARREVEALAGRLGRLETDLGALDRRVEAARGTEPVRPAAAGPSPELEGRVVRLAREVTPSIVSIQNGASVGSGVLISTDGYILTNEHVVDGAVNVAVQLSTGDTVPGRVLGRDTYSDVACVRIEGRDWPAIRLGDSDALVVGQVVAALGNPFGISRDGSPTVTLGIVSALHRVIPLSGERQYRDAIQTDAAINPGNSGGALVDLDGRLVGINGAITSTTGTNSGIGFAIPINFVKRILPALEAGRTTEPGFLGIQVGDLTHEQIAARGIRGAVVSAVTRGGPAERAGLRASDVIRTFQGEEIVSSTRLLNLISYYQAGETVKVEIWRGGRTLNFEITIGPRPR